jgi:hypothetical protein
MIEFRGDTSENVIKPHAFKAEQRTAIVKIDQCHGLDFAPNSAGIFNPL